MENKIIVEQKRLLRNVTQTIIRDVRKYSTVKTQLNIYIYIYKHILYYYILLISHSNYLASLRTLPHLSCHEFNGLPQININSKDVLTLYRSSSIIRVEFR